jgi:uncharacterized protein (DUF3084 family)
MTPAPEIYASAYQIGAWIAGCALGCLAMWLRASKAATTVTKDKAERDIIATLVIERDRAQADAREAWRQRTDDAQKIAKLSAEKEGLQRDVGRLTDEVARLRRSVDSLRALIQQHVPTMPTEALDSGHTPLEM